MVHVGGSYGRIKRFSMTKRGIINIKWNNSLFPKSDVELL
jgi:hypothetical protein